MQEMQPPFFRTCFEIVEAFDYRNISCILVPRDRSSLTLAFTSGAQSVLSSLQLSSTYECKRNVSRKKAVFFAHYVKTSARRINVLTGTACLLMP